MLEANKTLEFLNLETNFLSGDFLAKFFKAALKNQTLREVKCVNQVKLQNAKLVKQHRVDA